MSKTQSTDGVRQYGPGKFNTILDALVHGVSLSGCDDETGTVQDGAWYGMIRGEFKANGPFADFSATALCDLAEGFLTHEEQAHLREHSAGVILRESDHGFVAVDWYFYTAQLDADWQDILDFHEPE